MFWGGRSHVSDIVVYERKEHLLTYSPFIMTMLVYTCKFKACSFSLPMSWTLVVLCSSIPLSTSDTVVEGSSCNIPWNIIWGTPTNSFHDIEMATFISDSFSDWTQTIQCMMKRVKCGMMKEKWWQCELWGPSWYNSEKMKGLFSCRGVKNPWYSWMGRGAIRYSASTEVSGGWGSPQNTKGN